MAKPKKMNPDAIDKSISENEVDAEIQAELKELIKLNEIKAGALKKIMSQLHIDKENQDPS